MFAFLVLILCPEKPKQITVTIGNTIFGALSRQRKASWALIIHDVVQKLISKIGKKVSSIAPFLFHL